MRILKRLFGVAMVAAGALALVAPANANSLILNTSTADGNDCAGDFGKPPECYVNDSPLVAKFDWVDEEGQEEDPYWDFTKGLYASIDGSEFELSGGGALSGSFTYTPGAGDPMIKYWSVKNGSGYTLFWFTQGAPGSLSDAVYVPTGTAVDWSVVRNGLSHISFYNTGIQVPEPGSLALLGLGLMGLGFMRRRTAA